MDFINIIDQLYAENKILKEILLKHSQSVANKSLQIVLSHPELGADPDFVREAAMVHDIGIIECDAPGIHCHGKHPYIMHGVLGASIMRELGYDRHARVCERHTGTGITQEQIRQRALPLPEQDFRPQSIEEIIICYADKFYSKSRLETEKTVPQILKSLAKFGEDNVRTFVEWHQRFGINRGGIL